MTVSVGSILGVVTKDDVAQAIDADIPVDAREMARQLGCTASTVNRMAGKGIIPSILLGSREGARRYFPGLVKQALIKRSEGRKVLTKVRATWRGPQSG